LVSLVLHFGMHINKHTEQRQTIINKKTPRYNCASTTISSWTLLTYDFLSLSLYPIKRTNIHNKYNNCIIKYTLCDYYNIVYCYTLRLTHNNIVKTVVYLTRYMVYGYMVCFAHHTQWDMLCVEWSRLRHIIIGNYNLFVARVMSWICVIIPAGIISIMPKTFYSMTVDSLNNIIKV